MDGNHIDYIFDVLNDYVDRAREDGTPINDAAVARVEGYIHDVEDGNDNLDIDYLIKLSKEVQDTE